MFLKNKKNIFFSVYVRWFVNCKKLIIFKQVRQICRKPTANKCDEIGCHGNARFHPPLSHDSHPIRHQLLLFVTSQQTYYDSHYQRDIWSPWQRRRRGNMATRDVTNRLLSRGEICDVTIVFDVFGELKCDLGYKAE